MACIDILNSNIDGEVIFRSPITFLAELATDVSVAASTRASLRCLG